MFRRPDPERAAACPDQASALAGWMQSGAPQPIILGRARYAEDHLEQAVRQQEVKQYVILGAGLDTFAFRRPDLLAQPAGLRDRPSLPPRRINAIASWQINQENPGQLHFVPVDFEPGESGRGPQALGV